MPHGFSLIEILISFLLLSFILLGFNAMQISALRENQQTYFFSIAENQLHLISERLRVLEPKESISQLVADWNRQNQTVLPKGQGCISGLYPNYRIKIFWGDTKDNYLEQEIRI